MLNIIFITIVALIIIGFVYKAGKNAGFDVGFEYGERYGRQSEQLKQLEREYKALEKESR